MNTIASILHKNNLMYLSLDIIGPQILTVFLKLCTRKTICILEQIISVDKYLCIFFPKQRLLFISRIIIMFIYCPISNSLNQHRKNCMADSEENYKVILGVKRLKKERLEGKIELEVRRNLKEVLLQCKIKIQQLTCSLASGIISESLGLCQTVVCVPAQ